jgi:hypothetical protein
VEITCIRPDFINPGCPEVLYLSSNLSVINCRSDLYLPTNPESTVVAIIPESGTPMQSAAKVPVEPSHHGFQALACGSEACHL